MHENLTTDTAFIARCLQLAALGIGKVAPNPMVGAVLVHEQRIIGEGFHQRFGESHAEVNCIDSVSASDHHLIPHSTLYVSLEPCAHHGKTPPCADLIIRNQIRKVVVGCRDPFTEVDGKGIERLRAAGVEVCLGILEKDCLEINRRFICFHTNERPYVVLKWAQTADRKISSSSSARLMISNDFSNRLVHKWRAEESAILVGRNTVTEDDPLLTTRHHPGNNPVRILIDPELKISSDAKIFSAAAPTIIFNSNKETSSEVSSIKGLENQSYYFKISPGPDFVQAILSRLHQLSILSLIVEGGSKTLQGFIDSGFWDEARIITNTKLTAGKGLQAPVLADATIAQEYSLAADRISIFRRSIAQKIHRF